MRALAFVSIFALAGACAEPGGALEAGDAYDSQLPVLDDPFDYPQPSTAGLINTDDSLFAILEYGTLEHACDEYRADPDDRRKLLRCGKYQFFYESFGTGGVPRVLVKFVLDNFQDHTGPGFSKLGMILDPTSDDGMPLGLAPGPRFAGQKTLAYTCASCHFGRLPDGRYAVGAPNHDYEYGKQMLLLSLLPAFVNPFEKTEDHHPAAMAVVQPALDDFSGWMKAEFAVKTLPLLVGMWWNGQDIPSLTKEVEGFYASWRAGTMDFAIAPLPIEDNVHTVSKIIDLWDIPTREVATSYAPGHVQLSWSGSVPRVHTFLQGFAVIGAAPDAADLDEELAPLAAYVETLRAPEPPAPSPAQADSIARGEELFYGAGCADCHSGPAGSGVRIYSYDEIGTDDAMMYWADPELTGEVCCGIPSLAPLTNGIKAPRLTGTWAKRLFLHNGSVEGLERLFCLDEERPTNSEPVFGDDGHRMTCDGLDENDKLDLIAWLASI